jgi:TPR repeat protein
MYRLKSMNHQTNLATSLAGGVGSARAMAEIGLLYINGEGVTQDYAKAREWYEKAADKGGALGMFRLGRLYHLTQDYAKAREWYEKAADKGDTRGIADLEELAVSEAAGAGRYAEALKLREALAVKVEEAETREGKPGKGTAEALDRVAWHALFAREFRKALIAADRAQHARDRGHHRPRQPAGNRAVYRGC